MILVMLLMLVILVWLMLTADIDHASCGEDTGRGLSALLGHLRQHFPSKDIDLDMFVVGNLTTSEHSEI